MVEKLFVVKIGGNVINDEESLRSFITDLVSIDEKVILVHGGGKIATEVGTRLGIQPQYHEGRRITDDQTIKLVTMVYGGYINKKIVTLISSEGKKAIGLTGADGNLLLAHRRPITDGIDYGWVGDIDEVNAELLSQNLENGLIPVIAPLTTDGEGQILNTNADTIASEIAGAMASAYEVHLLYCFEKNGVLEDVNNDDSVIPSIDEKSYSQLKASGAIHTGMLPKLTNSFHALSKGVSEVIIGHSNKLGSLTQTTYDKCTRISA